MLPRDLSPALVDGAGYRREDYYAWSDARSDRATRMSRITSAQRWKAPSSVRAESTRIGAAYRRVTGGGAPTLACILYAWKTLHTPGSTVQLQAALPTMRWFVSELASLQAGGQRRAVESHPTEFRT